MCYTPPTLIIVHVGLVQHFIEDTVLQLKLKLFYDRQSVGQSVLVSGAHLGHLTNVSFSLKLFSDICVFVIL
jgi:hypothetical protein